MIISKYVSIVAMLLAFGNSAAANPNDPPSCDPYSEDFPEAAENSVVLVVPGNDSIQLGPVLEGCEYARQLQAAAGGAVRNCVAIRSDDLGVAVEAIRDNDVKVQGILSQFENFDAGILGSVSGHINGSMVLQAQPWGDNPDIDRSVLFEYGSYGYNMLK